MSDSSPQFGLNVRVRRLGEGVCPDCDAELNDGVCTGCGTDWSTFVGGSDE